MLGISRRRACGHTSCPVGPVTSGRPRPSVSAHTESRAEPARPVVWARGTRGWGADAGGALIRLGQALRIWGASSWPGPGVGGPLSWPGPAVAGAPKAPATSPPRELEPSHSPWVSQLCLSTDPPHVRGRLRIISFCFLSLMKNAPVRLPLRPMALMHVPRATEGAGSVASVRRHTCVVRVHTRTASQAWPPGRPSHARPWVHLVHAFL